MMRKVLTLVCAVMLIATCFSGCGGGGKAAGAEVWSAPGTIKVLKTYDEENGLVYSGPRGEAALAVSMAKNEYESAQLILTATEDVPSYDLAVSALTGPNGAEIPAGDVSVYNQHYIQTTTRHSDLSQPGWYPEALIPFDKAKAAGENKIVRGENQGIWVKFRTRPETPAGTYTGTFQLRIGKGTREIPVSVSVWDFAIADEVHASTAFLTYQDSIIQGEGDNTDEMLEAYYEFFLENRITSAYLPARSNDEARFFEMLTKYFDDPRVTAYALPYVTKIATSGTYIGSEDVDWDRLTDLVAAIAVKSVEDEKDYLSKAYLYCTLIDEFDQVPERKKMAPYISRQFKNVLIPNVQKKLLAEDPNFFTDTEEGIAIRSQVLASIKGLRDLAVARPTAAEKDLFNLWSVPATYYNNPVRRAEFSEWLKDSEVWWYTCVGPKQPEVTYHIDDNLITSRVLSWMMKDYGLTGNLYWSTAAYVRRVDGDEERPVDPYTEPCRFGDSPVTGDGYLVYPGAKYGVKGPIGSVRTESIRDGEEDYEYLYELEKMYAELTEYYGTEVSADAALRTVYDSLYRGTVAYTDVDLLAKARNDVAALLVNAGSFAKIVVDDVTHTGDGIRVTVLAAGDVQIRQNGADAPYESQGNGRRYVFTLPYQDNDIYLRFDYTNGSQSGSFSKKISTGTGFVSKLDDEAGLALVNVTKDGVKELCGTDIEGTAKSVKITATSVLTGDPIADAAFRPGFYFDSEALGEKLARVKDLSIRVYNPTDGSLSMNFTLITDLVNRTKTITLKPGWNTVAYNDISNVASVTRFYFSFDNVNDAMEPMDTVVYISGFKYTLFGEQ